MRGTPFAGDQVGLFIYLSLRLKVVYVDSDPFPKVRYLENEKG